MFAPVDFYIYELNTCKCLQVLAEGDHSLDMSAFDEQSVLAFLEFLYTAQVTYFRSDPELQVQLRELGEMSVLYNYMCMHIHVAIHTVHVQYMRLFCLVGAGIRFCNTATNCSASFKFF